MDYGGGPVSFPYGMRRRHVGGGGRSGRAPDTAGSQAEADSASAAGGQETAAVSGEDSIKVGILHSLSGTMAISETSVRDAELLAIKEINENGGVLGKQLVPVIEDGASDNAVFKEKAEKLLLNDKVAAVFGLLDFCQQKSGASGI